ncbi:MAG TPA: hypothetical protein VK698_39415 [Kofleriaceae bacterium]|nr:hypothetical protein [Kofleriaceae bacterium]
MGKPYSNAPLKGADHVASRPGRTPQSHYAAARSAEDVARGLSLRFTVRSFTGRFADDVDAVAVERAELKAARDSYSLLAAAHRSAARRMERVQRLRSLVRRAVA